MGEHELGIEPAGGFRISRAIRHKGLPSQPHEGSGLQFKYGFAALYLEEIGGIRYNQGVIGALVEASAFSDAISVKPLSRSSVSRF